MIAAAVISVMMSGQSAQTAAQFCPTLSDVQRIAESSDPRGISAKAQSDLARAELSAARSARLPQISTFSRAGVGDGQLQSNLNDNEFGVQLRQELYSFGQTSNSIRAAQDLSRAGQLEREIVGTDLRREAANAYIALVTALELIAVRNKAEQLYYEEADSINDRLTENAITRPEAARIDAAAALATASKEDAIAIAQRARSDIESLIGIPLECQNLSISPNQTLEIENDLAAFSQDQARSLVSDDPRVRQARLETSAALHRRREISRRHFPRVEVTAFQSTTYNDDIDDWLERERIGVNISQDLFRGGMLRAERRRAAAELERAQADARFLERRLREDMTSRLRRLSAYRRALDALEVASRSQERRLAGKRSQYEASAISIGELINAAEDYFETEEERLLTRQGYQ